MIGYRSAMAAFFRRPTHTRAHLHRYHPTPAGVGYDDDGINGRNYNNGKAALAVAKRSALHVAGTVSPAASAVIISGDLTYGGL